MNKILKFIGCIALGTIALASCSPEDFDGPNGNVPLASDYEGNVSVWVDQETNYAYFSFKEAPGISPVWILDGVQYKGDFSTKKYYRKAGTYTVQCKVKNANGISAGAIEKSFTVDKTIATGFTGFDSESDKNLFKTATVTQAAGYYAPNWEQIADPTIVHRGRDFSVILPAATTEQWQCQVPLETDICTTADPDVTYDFSVLLTSTTDHGGMTIKLTNPYNDGDFYFQEKQILKAGEPTCFYITGMPSRNINNLKLFFDFGGNAEDTEVMVEGITFMKSSDNTIVPPSKDPEPVWVDVNSEENLWNTAEPKQIPGFYAPGWSQISDPAVNIVDGKIMISLPEATFERWQAQVPFELNLGITDTEQEYDFLAVIESNAKFKPMVKLTDATNDDNYLFADDSKALEEGGELRFFKTKVKMPSPCSSMKLFFDFGGNPAGTEIAISNIILQKHKE